MSAQKDSYSYLTPAWLGRLAICLLGVVYLLFPVPLQAQQGGSTYYVYDGNGRLRAVVSPTGEAAVYDYDPAGNFTAIRRLGVNAVELLSFTPKVGAIGDRVTFYGVGLGTGVSNVSFNGVSAQVLESTLTKVVAAVPLGATTGLVSITNPRGTVTTTEPFTVKGVTILPTAATVVTGEHLQLIALVSTPSGNQSVRWTVNGVEGGNNTVGTITTAGLYTAPDLPPAQPSNTFTVRATSLADTTLFREAVVTVRNLAFINSIPAAAVAVRVGQNDPASTLTTAAPVAAAVAVRVGQNDPASTLTIAAPFAAAVMVNTGPRIAAIAPAQITRGVATVVTITGLNLSGTTVLRFFGNGGVLDSTVTATSLSVNGAGTSLTATITASGGAALGQRLFVVSATAGNSLAFETGTNLIQINP